ncbi:LexA family transcriptional regulator [Treponema denticola]|uniref:S24 family peptidase n=1 Tax=Treponema denticola TaxID=158 RepID=UPI003D9342C0
MEKLEEKDRLKLIRQEMQLTQGAMAEKFEKVQATWSAYELGKIPVSADVYIQLQEMGFNIEWLKNGVGEMYADKKIAINTNQPDDKVAMIRFIPYGASAGYGRIFDAYDTFELIPVLKSLIAPYKPEQVFAIAAVGDSMIGSKIFDGDIVFFSPKRKEGNGIFVITVDNKAFVKRLEFDPLGKWVKLISDNPLYEIQKIGEEYSASFKIEGRVIAWMHRNRE